MCRCPWRPGKAVESYEDGIVGGCEPANVATGIRTAVLMTEQLTLPSWVSSFSALLKWLHDIITYQKKLLS